MKIDFNSIGLENKCLYEILATTYKIKNEKIIPNTACMGIIIDNDIIKIRPYPETNTYKNIKKNKTIVINFIDDIFLYSLAGLKFYNQKNDLEAFPEKYHDSLEVDNYLALYLKDSWAYILGRVSKEEQIIKKDKYGETEMIEFEILPLKIIKSRESFKVFNRAENLALEIIILATRLKLAVEIDDELRKNEIVKQIREYILLINRLGKSSKVLKTIDYIKNFINTLEINL